MWNIKALELTVQKLLVRFKFSKNGSNSKIQGHRVKINGTHGKVSSQGILMWNIKALALTVQKLLARLKFQRGGQNDRMTDRTKTKSPPHPIFDRGHKKCMYNNNDLHNNALCLIIFLITIVYQTIMQKKPPTTTTVMSYLNRKNTFKYTSTPESNLFNYLYRIFITRFYPCYE